MPSRSSRATTKAVVGLSLAGLLASGLASGLASALAGLAPSPAARPPSAARWCTPTVCVHTDEPLSNALRADHALVERALAELPLLDLPLPEPDGGRGGSFALDVYLGDAPAAAWADPAVGTFDTPSAYLVAPSQTSGPPCARRHLLTRAVIQASLIGLDAAAHEGILALQSGHLAQLLAPCPPLRLAAFDAFQREPEEAWLVSHRAMITGASWIADYIDRRYGDGYGAVSTALVALGTQQTPAGAASLRNEPDWFDVLRNLLPPRGTTLGGFLLDVAVARAFVGDRGYDPDQARWLGALGRPRFAWSVDYDSLPRRLGPRRLLEPTGATYLFVDTTGVEPHRGLWIIADHEVQHVVTWAAVTLDASGRATSTHVFGGVFGADRAELTLERLDGVAGVLLVGSHEGSDDRSRPYDPDDGPPRPTGWEVTLRPK